VYQALKARGIPVQLYLHQGGHGGSAPFRQMNRWFTRWLYEIDNGVEDDPLSWIVREGASPSEPTPYDAVVQAVREQRRRLHGLELIPVVALGPEVVVVARDAIHTLEQFLVADLAVAPVAVCGVSAVDEIEEHIHVLTDPAARVPHQTVRTVVVVGRRAGWSEAIAGWPSFPGLPPWAAGIRHTEPMQYPTLDVFLFRS